MSKKIVLAGACRTPIGKMGGVFVNTYTPELATIVVKEALKRSGVPAEAVDEVILGCVFQGGIGQNVARQAAVYAGIPISTPAFTLNNLCGSGLKSVNVAAGLIQAGQADVIVAGGAENMSNAPYLLKKARFGYRLNDGVLIDSMQNDGLWDTFHHYPMGITAENVAEKYGITREMQDEFSANSQQKCQKALAAGKFNDEIVPVEVKQKKQTVLIDKDEAPRAGITAESISHLKPCFKEGGTVTAANSSGINDAASAIVLMTEDKAKELGIKPMAYWIDGASAGVDPAYMGLGPIDATKKVMKHSGMSVKDMDLVEANEAFAAQSIEVCRELDLDMDKVNVNGGAIALGHPVGCSGCRILTTLLYEMQHRGSEYGLATLCVGGGMGVATIVKRYE
ncbi:MAG: acetyl-CoA C-acetyltransferase [Oscillospiraceae bacterium]|nr:acetyl-CoA C-acetyltransferase [Oscillospiraceae bacterium]